MQVLGVPGNSNVNPGETFGINDFKSRGSKYSSVLVDGQGVGASGLGINSSSEVYIGTSAFLNNVFSAGVALWQTRDVTLISDIFRGNQAGLNIERCSGIICIVRPTFEGNEVDIRIMSDLKDKAQVVIEDPDLGGAQKIRVRLLSTYRNGTNIQTPADLVVSRNGVDVTSSVVEWVR